MKIIIKTVFCIFSKTICKNMDQTQLMFMMSNMRNKSDNLASSDDIYRRIFVYLIEGVLLLLMTSVFNEFISYLKHISVFYWKILKTKIFKKTCIILEGYQESYSSVNTLRHNITMNALGFYVYRKNIIDKICITDKSEYILDSCNSQKLTPDIYLDVRVKDCGSHSSGINNPLVTRTISTYSVYSYKLDYDELEKFLSKIACEYESYLENNNNGKQFHFIFSKMYEKTEPIFHKSLIIDSHNPSYGSYETFDNIFSEHRDKIMRDITKLSDKEYYSRNGLKRKRGYLFYGLPGCGKTSFVMAIAHMAKRHIIEIPLSRVKTNSDFETILHITNINGVKVSRENSIILFDEIDVGLDVMKKRVQIEEKDSKDEKESPKERKNDDKLSLDTLLSRLDGIGNYNGLILIATTNCIEKIDPAMYRHGRLDPYYFEYCRQEDIANMIEKFYSTKLSQREKDNLPRKDSELTPATMRKYLCDHDTKDDLIKFLQKFKK